MTIEILKNEMNELANKTMESCKFCKIKEKENKEKFKYCGIYILTADNNEIVYVGSAYARNIRDRLLQYQQKKGSGNTSLYSDLIDSKKCKEENANKYINDLTINAFPDESLEYIIIKKTIGIINKAGNKKKSS